MGAGLAAITLKKSETNGRKNEDYHKVDNRTGFDSATGSWDTRSRWWCRVASGVCNDARGNWHNDAWALVSYATEIHPGSSKYAKFRRVPVYSAGMEQVVRCRCMARF